jgi:D-serine dehydratase
MRKEPFLWVNEGWQPLDAARARPEPTFSKVREAERKWGLFADLLSALFPELESTGALIDSALYSAGQLQKATMGGRTLVGRWFLKGDHALPIAGSIKARGGIYEVLLHAEALARENGLLEPQDKRRILASPPARALFAAHRIAVGSTGNLGLAIGVMAAALGFQATVHMSSDAKAWKKKRLRDRGVEVIEHDGDFGEAVPAGRAQARQDPNSYFIDDE